MGECCTSVAFSVLYPVQYGRKLEQMHLYGFLSFCTGYNLGESYDAALVKIEDGNYWKLLITR